MVTKKQEAIAQTTSDASIRSILATPAAPSIEPILGELLAPSLEQAIFIEVLGSLAARGVPPDDAAEQAKLYAVAGAAVYGNLH